MRRVRFLLEAAAFRLLLAAAALLPRRTLHALGGAAGWLASVVDRRHRRIAIENLRLAFGGELDEAARRRIARSCWRHFGRITLDALAFPRYSGRSVGTLVRYEGIEHIRQAYARGRGVLLFSAHYGHWELVALMQGFLGLPLHLVARPLDNPRLEAMLTAMRTASGNEVIHKRRAVKEMLRVLARGGGIAIVIDQDARDHGVFVPFFGRLASTTPTLAALALRTAAAVVPVFSVPEADGSFLVVYEPAVELAPSGSPEEDTRRLTAACTAIIERWVRLHPELWLWMHRRWKTAPRGAAAPPCRENP